MGMRGAVDYGTARRANYDPTEPILGKTGTCTDFRVSTHMGWFGSFNEVNHHQLVVVVMLTGTKSINGPVAAGVARRDLPEAVGAALLRGRPSSGGNKTACPRSLPATPGSSEASALSSGHRAFPMKIAAFLFCGASLYAQDVLISAERIREHTKFLSSDLMEGRGPGTARRAARRRIHRHPTRARGRKAGGRKRDLLSARPAGRRSRPSRLPR